MDNDYLYHCRGCKKPDEEYPNELQDCDECNGSGIDDTEEYSDGDFYYCWKCGGDGNLILKTKVEYHMWARTDAYGIYTGLYCDKCYKDNYSYKKHRYHDESYCGERLESDG